MKLLMFSTDSKIFESGSPVEARMKAYGTLFDELHIIVFGRKRGEEKKISDRVTAYGTGGSRVGYFKNAANMGRKIIRDRSFGKGDRITAQDPFETGHVAEKVGREFGIPVQIQVHTDFLNDYFKKESLKNRLRAFRGLKILRVANGIRVVSERIKKSLTERGISESKITLLPINVPKRQSEHAPQGTAPLIFLILCRLTREKNISLALRALETLHKEKKDFAVNIVGDGECRESLVKEVKRRGLEDVVHFEPWTPNPPEFFSGADLFLVTSNYEGYGRTIIEAALAGTPTLMTDVGIAGEIIKNGENGFVVPVGDERAFTAKLRTIVEKPEIVWSLSEKVKKIGEQLPDPERFLADYKSALEKIA